MRVIIEIRSGHQEGRKFVVRSGQVMQFGSTEEADAVIEFDDELSRLHFCIDTTGSRCKVRDLGSVNGTQVNGQFVQEAMLGNQDVITAGRTQFAIRVAGGASANPGHDEQPTTVVTDRSRVTLEPSQPRPSFRVETCSSGLTLVTGAMFGEPDEPTSIAEVAGPLSKRFSQFTLVDFRAAELPIPDQLDDRVPLFDWLPAVIAAEQSPLIIPPTATLDVASLLNEAWDHDAAIVLYSEQDPESMIRHLRKATRLNLDGSFSEPGSNQGMLGYCWPSVLAALLAFRSPEFVEALLPAIDAVLIEIPDLPGTWHTYSQRSFPDILVAMGFRRRHDQEAPPDAMAVEDP